MVCSYVGDHRLTWATAWSWLKGEAWDSRHDSRQQKLQEVRVLSTPTLMIQGESDFCDAPSESDGLEAYFTGRYHIRPRQSCARQTSLRDRKSTRLNSSHLGI